MGLYGLDRAFFGVNNGFMLRILTTALLIAAFASPSWAFSRLASLECCRLDKRILAKAVSQNAPVDQTAQKADKHCPDSQRAENAHINHGVMQHEHMDHGQMANGDMVEDEAQAPPNQAGAHPNCGSLACGLGLSNLSANLGNLSSLSLASVNPFFPLPHDDSAPLSPYNSPPFHPPRV